MREVFIHPSGQDDNLGDSALRAALLASVRVHGPRLHVLTDGQSTDYMSGLSLAATDVVYDKLDDWISACRRMRRPVLVLNAGEVNPAARSQFPNRNSAAPLRAVARGKGIVIAMGMGMRMPAASTGVRFHRMLRNAAVTTWRDAASRDTAGFGDVAPDWAFALGTPASRWNRLADRPLLVVTLRFDRPSPDPKWHRAVRDLAERTSSKVVTIAQVARDAPRAVELASNLGGSYLVAPSTSHDDVDRHVRAVYARALAVVSDRAHALIIGATEGAYPIGTATDPQKISRILDATHLGGLTGTHDEFADRAARLERALPDLAVRVESARAVLRGVRDRVGGVISAES